jgi:hypothetical protein
MTRKRHTEEQIIAVLKDDQAGVNVLVCSTRQVPEQHGAPIVEGGGRGLVKGNLFQPHRFIGHSAGTGRPRALERVCRHAVGRDRTMSYRGPPAPITLPPRHASDGLPQSARLCSIHGIHELSRY